MTPVEEADAVREDLKLEILGKEWGHTAVEEARGVRSGLN